MPLMSVLHREMQSRALVIPAIAAVCSSVLVSSACSGPNCATVETPGLVVTVESASGSPLCDASVVVSNGSQRVTFSPTVTAPSPAPCNVYVGPLQHPGKYTITVSAGGRTTTVPAVSVQANACGLITRRVTVKVPSS